MLQILHYQEIKTELLHQIQMLNDHTHNLEQKIDASERISREESLIEIDKKLKE